MTTVESLAALVLSQEESMVFPACLKYRLCCSDTRPDLSCCKPTAAFLGDVISRGPDKAVHTGVKRLNVHIKQQTLSLPSCQCITSTIFATSTNKPLRLRL